MKLLVKKHPSAHTLAECIEADDTAIAENGYVAMTVPEFEAWKAAAIAAGWKPEQADVEDAPVPESVGPDQLRQALDDVGIADDTILSCIAAIPDPALRRKVTIHWTHAMVFERDHPQLAMLTASLGLSPAQVDDIFRKAAEY